MKGVSGRKPRHARNSAQMAAAFLQKYKVAKLEF